MLFLVSKPYEKKNVCAGEVTDMKCSMNVAEQNAAENDKRYIQVKLL